MPDLIPGERSSPESPVATPQAAVVRSVVDEAIRARGFDNYMLDNEREELTTAIGEVLARHHLHIVDASMLALLGVHLTALCDHQVNWENRYQAADGRPCPGCYDARDAYRAYVEANAGDAGAHDDSR